MKSAIFKILRRMLLAALSLVVLAVCFRGPLYRLFVVYEQIGVRAPIRIENESVMAELDAWLYAHPSATTEQMVGFAADYATKGIAYTLGKCAIDPNDILKRRNKTNCIGYSATLHAVMSYFISKKRLESTLTSEHKVAHLYLLGYSVHPFFSDPAFRDHDYNVVTDLVSGRKYAIDPSLTAVFGISRVKEKCDR